MDEYEDEDMARAIALSLQESASPTAKDALNKTSEVIDISDDEDGPDDVEERRFQAELQRAIQASKEEETQRPTSHPAPSASATSINATHSASPFLSERAQLERERLARQKRLRPDDEVGDTSATAEAYRTKRQCLPTSSAQSRGTDIRASGAASITSASTSRHVAAAPSGPANSSVACYWDGEMRQTANMHVNLPKDTKPTFRLSDILAPRDDIELAIVSAYVYSFPWLYSFFNPATPVIAVAQDPKGEETIKSILPNWVRTTPFLRNGMGCMHMKFMLLFYKSGRLRVVVSTANMIEYDWRDIENTVWLQDVPKRLSPIAHDPKADDFATAFIRVLRAINVGPALVSHINDHPNLPLQRLEHVRSHWDFTKVKAKLIPSIAGKHEGWSKVVLTGHTTLMKAIRDLGLTATKDREVILECQGSSIGSYSTQWMNEFHCSTRGESAQSWLDTSKARRAKLPYPPIKILFPTAQYVHESVLGDQGGGTMFCRRSQWEAAKFPRDLFHQSRSKRGRVLMHSKMILGMLRQQSSSFGSAGGASDSETEPEDEDDGSEETQWKPVGWLYMGSHNFTPSAWGTLSGSAFNPTLNITNYELGLVLPVRSEDEVDRLVCWERPPRKYALGKDEPWIQSESSAFAEHT